MTTTSTRITQYANPANGRGLVATSAESDRLLRRVLLGNATFSLVGGAAALVLGGPLSDLFDINTWLMRVIGAGLVMFAADVLWVATRGSLSRARFARWISAADATWVLATVAVIVFGLTSTRGAIVAAVVGLVVADFSIVQWRTAAKVEREAAPQID